MQDSSLEMIDDLRQKMYRVAQGRQLTDPKVIAISKMLDCLLNQYFYLGES